MIAVDIERDIEIETDTFHLIPNDVTLAAVQETSDIMSGKKRVKWNRFKSGTTRAEAKEELKKILDP